MADIFGKITSGINKGVATVGTGSKAMIEKARIKTIIKNLETEKANLAELLGMNVYEKYSQGEEKLEDKSIENFILEIGKRLESIAEQQAELRRIDDEMNQVTGNKGNTSNTEKTCVCGNSMPSGAKFCTKCGNSL